jgi:hypothetical protein
MTDLNVAQDEQSQEDAYDSLLIGDLRKFAKMLGIQAKRDWTKDDFIAAIKSKQANAGFSLALDANAPKPGHSRLTIHRDPTPGHKNNPIHLGVNGRIIAVPRGVEVDVETAYIEVLKNAITVKTEQDGDASFANPAGTYKEVPNVSYPYSVSASTPGNGFNNPFDGRQAQAERKAAFHKAFGRWPTDGELKEAMRQKIINELK